MSASGELIAFHQQEQLTTRLHNILAEYPPGIGPFQEFLQVTARSLLVDLSDWSRPPRALLFS